MIALFDSDSEDEEFYGFTITQPQYNHYELNELFDTDESENENEFLGFTSFEVLDMNSLFQSDDKNEEFFGF